MLLYWSMRQIVTCPLRKWSAAYESMEYYRQTVKPVLEVGYRYINPYLNWSLVNTVQAAVLHFNNVCHVVPHVQDGSSIEADVYVWKDEYK